MVYLFAGTFFNVWEEAKELLFTGFVWKKPVFCGIIFVWIKKQAFYRKVQVPVKTPAYNNLAFS